MKIRLFQRRLLAFCFFIPSVGTELCDVFIWEVFCCQLFWPLFKWWCEAGYQHWCTSTRFSEFNGEADLLRLIGLTFYYSSFTKRQHYHCFQNAAEAVYRCFHSHAEKQSWWVAVLSVQWKDLLRFSWSQMVSSKQRRTPAMLCLYTTLWHSFGPAGIYITHWN